MSVRSENSLLLRQGLAPVDRPSPRLTTRVGRRIKAGVATVLWFGAGTAVVTYGTALVYANVARVEIDSAIVSGVVEAMQAPTAGRLRSNLMAGATLRAGDRLFNVINADIEEKIGLASVRVDRARSDLLLKIAERDAERARRDSFLLATKADVERTRADVNASVDLETTARSRFDAATELFGKGVVTRLRLEDVTDRLAQAKMSRIQAQNRLEEKTALLEEVKAGRLSGGLESLGRIADAEAAVRRADAEVRLSANELRVLMEHRANDDTTADTAGRVLRVLKLNGTAVQPGDTVALVERDGDRIIYAFLTQEEVGRVSVDDDAEVILPAQHLTARAKVVNVERSGGYLDDVESRYMWRLARDPGIRHTDRDRTARVTLRFASKDQAVANRQLAPGTPAFVSFRRSWEATKIVEAYMTLEQFAASTVDRIANGSASKDVGQSKLVSER